MNDYVIEIEQTFVDVIIKEYPVLFRTYQHYFPKLSNTDIALMVNIATGVCPHCWSNARGCQCWNDE